MAGLVIRRMENRYRLPGGLAEPDAMASGLDDVARRDLPAAVASLLPGLLADAGLPPEAEVALRRLRLRLRARGGPIPRDRLAAAWAEALARAAVSLLRPIAPASRADRPVVLDDEVAVFPDRITAEVAYLVMRAQGTGAAWWWRPVLGRDGTVPSPAAVVAGWIEDAPGRAGRALARVAALAPGGLDALWSEAEAAMLIDRWIARSVDAVPAPDSPPRGMAETRVDAHTIPPVPAAAVPVLRAADGKAVRRLLALAFVHDRLPVARPVDTALLDAVIRHAVGAGTGQSDAEALSESAIRAEADAATGDTPARMPAGEDAAGDAHDKRLDEDRLETVRSDPVAVDADRLPRDAVATSDSDGPTEAMRTEAWEAEPPASQPAPPSGRAAGDAGAAVAGQAPEQDRPPPPVPEETLAALLEQGFEVSAGQAFEVGCGGLLLLIRPVLRLPLVRDHAGAALQERLAALGRLVLGRVLCPLPPAARRAALLRERPVLAVFAGMEDLPDTADSPASSDAAHADAARALAGIEAAIPDGIAPDAAALRFSYGSARDPFAKVPQAHALAAVVLRRGRLVLGPHRADLHMPIECVDTDLRRTGWDIDPGWVPDLGRTVHFHYEDS